MTRQLQDLYTTKKVHAVPEENDIDTNEEVE